MIYQVWNHHIDSWSVPNVLNTENSNNEQDSLQPIYYVVDLLKYDKFHIIMMKGRHCDAGLSNRDGVRLRRGYYVLSKAIMCKTYVVNILSKVFQMFVHFRLSWLPRLFNITNRFMELTGSKGENCKERGKTMFFSLGLAFYGLTDECESSRRFYLEPFQHCAAKRELTMPPTQAASLSHNDS